MKYCTLTLLALCVFLVTSARPADIYQSEIPASIAGKTKSAQELRLQNKLADAQAALEPITKQYPDYFLARYNLGLTYSAQRDNAAAIEELKRAQQINIDRQLGEPTIYNALGWAYLQNGNYDQALSEFKLAQQPDVFTKLNAESQNKVLNNTGLAWAHLGHPDTATQFFGKAAAIQPADHANGSGTVSTGQDSKLSPELRRQLVAVLRSYLPERDLYVETIPANKLANATKELREKNIVIEDEIVALLDATVTGSAEKAMLFGLKGVYYRTSLQSRGPKTDFIPYSSLISMSFTTAKFQEVAIGPKDIFVVAGSSMTPKKLIDILNGVRAAISAKSVE
jgi:tetratricopeptide (TPR) repeat protein